MLLAQLCLALGNSSADFLCERRHIRLRTGFDLRRILGDLAVKLVFMILIVEEGSIHLRKRQRGIRLAHDLLGCVAMKIAGQGDVGDGDAVAFDTRLPAINIGITHNVLDIRRGTHDPPSLTIFPRATPVYPSQTATHIRRSSRCSPKTRRSVSLISPSVARDSTAARMRGSRFSVPRAAASRLVRAAPEAALSRRARRSASFAA